MHTHFVIKKNSMHLWRVYLPHFSTEVKTLSLLLSLDEAARASRFHFDTHRDRFTLTRAFLRKILSLYMQHSAKDLSFTYGPKGKPFLNHAEIQFNVSHSEDMAFFGFTLNDGVGVDIEKVQQPFNEEIAKRFFSTQEYEFLKQLPEEEKIKVFYQIWARKEALVKAIGVGLWMKLEGFTIIPQNRPELVTFYDDQKERTLQVIPIFAHPDYQAAVAVSPEVKETYYWQWLPAGPCAWLHANE